MDGYFKLTETDDKGVVVAIKYVNQANIATVNVEKERTVLIMNNGDTIRLPNTDANPFWSDCAGDFPNESTDNAVQK